jgi:predicted  nucleic acid-binding Zn-ribbon protein
MTTKHNCEQCGERYDEAGDGWCGTCPSCADKAAANDERREHARQVLEAYSAITDIGEDDATMLCDLLTDCMHLLGREAVEGQTRVAAVHYEAEKEAA